ncbi:hypothetical protein JCM14076_16940 [Methylosoma difficile]
MLSNGYRYYYSQLDAPMQSAYEAMLAGVKNYADTILLNPHFTLYESAISELVRAVKLDNPSVFYLASQYQYSIDGNAIWYKPQYLFDRAALQMMEVQLLDTVDNIVNNAIGWGMSDYDKELALHDYLIRNVAYAADSQWQQNPPEIIYTAYGALVNRQAVCSGFAHALKLLLDRCGIDCLVVTGNSFMPDSTILISHAWNIVNINQHFYHVDATWDAPTNKNPAELFHHYFNLTDQEIAIDHQWQQDVPSCYATEYNYFVHQGLNVADESTLMQWLQYAIGNRNPSLVFKYSGGNSTMDNENLNAMIADSWQQFGYNSLSWSLSFNDRQKIFNVEFSYG